MIGRLTGFVVEQGGDGACIVDVQGVGYELFIPLGHGAHALLGDEAGGPKTFYIHTHVREDAFVLYGFLNLRDRTAFRALLSVAGVGPKVALAIIGVLNADLLLQAIQQRNAAAFKGISGVGKKTTERILLDLQDKLAAALGPAREVPSSAPLQAPQAQGKSASVVQALTQLGYRQGEAEAAVSKLEFDDERPVEELLREALGLLG